MTHKEPKGWELANETREKIKTRAFYKAETGNALDLTETREILLEAFDEVRIEAKREVLMDILEMEQMDGDFIDFTHSVPSKRIKDCASSLGIALEDNK